MVGFGEGVLCVCVRVFKKVCTRVYRCVRVYQIFREVVCKCVCVYQCVIGCDRATRFWRSGPKPETQVEAGTGGSGERELWRGGCVRRGFSSALVYTSACLFACASCVCTCVSMSVCV